MRLPNRFGLLATLAVALAAANLGYAQYAALNNGIPGDGNYQVGPDAYGCVTDWPTPGNFDRYDPPGGTGSSAIMFASALYFYFPNLAPRERVALNDPASFQMNSTYNASLGNGSTMVLTLINAITSSDTDNDGFHDRATSEFRVQDSTLSAVNLRVSLIQNVYKPSHGNVGTYVKEYRITNEGNSAVSFLANQHDDGDLLFDGVWNDDAAGANSRGGLGRHVYQREPDTVPGNLTQSHALSGTTGYAYYAGRSGFDPDGPGPDPAMAYGTDFQIWNNYGVPTSWQNYVAGIGYNMDGVRGEAQPPGAGNPYDSFIGLQWSITLQPGQCTKLTVTHTLGDVLANCYVGGDSNCDGVVNNFDIDSFVQALLDRAAYLTAHPTCDHNCANDVNRDGSVDNFDIDPFVAAVLGGGC